MLSEIENRLLVLEQKMNQMFRVGTVTSVAPDPATARVSFPDADGMLSYDLPVLVPKTHQDKYYRMPDVGEQVLCVFLPFGLEQGFVLGAFYSSADGVPAADGDKTCVVFGDGASVEYDRAGHKLTITTSGAIDITAQSLSVTGDISATGKIDAGGDISASGKLAAGGDITSGGNITATGTVHGSNI